MRATPRRNCRRAREGTDELIARCGMAAPTREQQRQREGPAKTRSRGSTHADLQRVGGGRYAR